MYLRAGKKDAGYIQGKRKAECCGVEAEEMERVSVSESAAFRNELEVIHVATVPAIQRKNYVDRNVTTHSKFRYTSLHMPFMTS